MPAMKALKLCNRCPTVAGAARSYSIIVLNLMAVTRRVGTR
jgi:hypothetical protein